jgi:hypothetical protein
LAVTQFRHIVGCDVLDELDDTIPGESQARHVADVEHPAALTYGLGFRDDALVLDRKVIARKLNDSAASRFVLCE